METQPLSLSPQPAAASFWSRAWVRGGVWALGSLAVIYGMVYVDVCLRARSAYLEGQKYERWAASPQDKKAELEKKFEERKAELEKRRSKLSEEDYRRELEIIAFDRNREMAESSLKYAYTWYKTAYELFSPPESQWVRLSRERAPIVKAQWKEELKAQNVPFEEYMIE